MRKLLLLVQSTPFPACLPLIQVLTGLQYLAERGVVHRDLKPANILLARPCGPHSAPVLQITDFGVWSYYAVNVFCQFHFCCHCVIPAAIFKSVTHSAH